MEALESRRVLATYFVDTTVDTDTGICAADNPGGNIGCSIRSAILAAEANPGADTIRIPDGTYTNEFNGSFDLFEAQDLSFVGNLTDPAAVVIDGQNQFRLFDIFGSGSLHTVSFQGMTLQNGINGDSSGGGAVNAGDETNLVFDQVVIQNNAAVSYLGSPTSGGGVQASGNVTITNSVIRDNSATRNGGGIDFTPSANKALTITDTTISGNVTGDSQVDLGYGGGVFINGPNATVTLTRVIVDGNAAGDSGGGVYNRNAALSVSSSTFRNNQALGSESGGGGLYVLGQGPSSPAFNVSGGTFSGNSAVAGAGGFEAVNNGGTIDGATFSINRATGAGTDFDQGGGAIAILSTVPSNASPVTLRNLLVTENSAPSAGGIAAVDADLTIENSTIIDNDATGPLIGSAGGIGAIATSSSVLNIRNSSILSNSAVLQAGGIGAIDVNVIIEDSIVDGNVAVNGRAGGIGLATQGIGIVPLLQLDAVTINNNQSAGDGGGIGVEGASFVMVNTTVSGNRSLGGNGGGIALVNASPFAGSTILFSTIASNQASAGSNIALQNSGVALQGTIVANGTGVGIGSSFLSNGFNLDESGTLGLAGTGDLSGVDPRLGPLQDNGGPVPTHALLPGSPAIDAGPPDGPSTDARGVPRPQDGDGVGGVGFDIGAFEAEPVITSLVVDSTTDIDDGDYSPGNLSLREAISLVNTGVAAGTTITFDSTLFAVPQTITLSGTQLDVTSSVEIVGPGQSLLTISGNDQSRIFGFNGSGIIATLSGMTLTDGFAPDPFTGNGGAIENRGATLSILDSTITGNRALGNGGGILNDGSLTVIDSTISANQASGPYSGIGYGGGIRNFGTLVLTRSSITGNSAGEDGGGIANDGDVTAVDSVIAGNQAVSFGGGIASFSGTVDMTRGSVSNNDSGDSGGGIFNSGSSLAIRDSTISGNRAVVDGGGVFNYGGGSVQLINSTVSGNQADRDGGGISNGEPYDGPTNSLVTINSTIVGNRSDADGNGEGIGGGISTVPSSSSSTSLFNTIVAGNVAGSPGSDVPSDLANQNVDSASAFNLVGHPQSAGGLIDGVSGNIVGLGGSTVPLSSIVDPMLADNGGGTLTHALAVGSPAIDAGSSSLATTPGNDGIPGTGDTNEATLTEDQRGTSFPRINGTSVDIGSFEAPASAPPARITISDVLVSEADGTATVIVTLQDPTAESFTLSYATVDGSATSSGDFVGAFGTLDFSGTPFEQASFVVSISDDGIAEARESFLVELTVAAASEPLDVSDVGTVTILDDDEAVLSIADVQVNEATGVLVVSVVLSGETDESFTVDLSTGEFQDGATSGVDFLPSVQTLDFSGFDGEQQSFSVSISDDLIVEGDETFAIVADNIVSNGSNVHFSGFAYRIDLLGVGQFNSPSTFSRGVDLDTANDIAYLADDSGLYVIDVSDPTKPTQLGRYDTPTFEVKVVGSIAYALTSGGLEVLDVADPSNITQLDVYTPPSLFISSMDVVGATVYLGLIDSFSTGGGLAILNASDPANLSLIGEIATGGVVDVAVSGDVAYVAQPFSGLTAFDITDPAAISAVGFADVQEPLTITVEGTTAYIGTFDRLSVWDIADPAAISPLGDYLTDVDLVSIDVDATDPSRPIVYVAAPATQLGSFVEVIDASDFSNMQRIGVSTAFSQSNQIVVSEGLAFVADGAGGLQVVLADSTHVSDATIVNDDIATLTVSDITVNEASGTASVIVTLDNAVQGGFSYEFTTNDGTATQGSDYTATSGSFTSGSAGEQQTITIPILSDSVPEGIETFTVTLLNVIPFGSVSPSAIDATDVGVVTITEAGVVDLAITKTDSQDPVRPSADLIYTLVVTNNGTAGATGVFAVDALPTGVLYSGGNVDGDESRVTEDSGTVFANVGDLAAGASATITIVVNVQPDAVGILSNNASVSSNEVDSDPTDNAVTEATGIDRIAVTDDSYDFDEDDPRQTLDVLANDSPGPGGPLLITSVTPASRGTVSIAVGGTRLEYVPDPNEFGSDSFVYTVQSPTGLVAFATVAVDLAPVNDAPIALNDTVNAPDRTGLSIPIASLLSNDSAGPDNELQIPVFVSADSMTTAGGTITQVGSELLYTPVASFLGIVDTFTYTITDGEFTDLATVTINLPPPPSIFGHIYCDLDGTGQEDSGEASAGVRVFLDLDGDRILDPGEQSTLSDSNGDYQFFGVSGTAVTVVAEVPAGCNTIPYSPGVVRTTIGVGLLARSIAQIDIDADNDLDLLVASERSNSLAVLVNEGGNFTLQREIALSDGPRSVAAWLDEETGIPVVAVAAVGTLADAGSLFVFELDNTPAPVKVGNGPIDVVFDDFDLDGQPDVLVGTLRSSNVQLFLNGGEVPSLIGVARLVRTVGSGDVNGDGLPDIVVGGYGYPADPESDLVVLLGDGTGAFGAPIAAEISQKLIAIEVADLTSDVENGEDTRVFALSASGQFKAFQLVGEELIETSVLTVPAGSTSFGLGDFNRDGLTDVAIANQGQQTIDLYVGDGQGVFVPILTLDSVAAPSDLVVGDLDNDGQVDDLAVTNLYQDANIGLPGPREFFLPSGTTILRLDVAEAPVVIGGMATRVDFVFESADPDIRMDVSGDGMISALDALRVINAMARSQLEGEQFGSPVRALTDVNGDGRTSAVDALMIINFLTGHSEGQVSVDEVNLLSDGDDDPSERIAAVDVVLGQLF